MINAKSTTRRQSIIKIKKTNKNRFKNKSRKFERAKKTERKID